MLHEGVLKQYYHDGVIHSCSEVSNPKTLNVVIRSNKEATRANVGMSVFIDTQARHLSFETSVFNVLSSGTRVAVLPGEMNYELIPVIAFLGLLFTGGFLLIADAAVRFLRRR